MVTPSPTAPPPDIVIELTTASDVPAGHRLGELVQALTGCSAERAELAVADPTPVGPTSSDEALRKTAEALCRIRASTRATTQPA
jgi:hypothetical protein